MTPASPSFVLAVEWDVQRLVAVGSLVLTVGLLGLAIATCRRPSRVRVALDVGRVLVSTAAILVMAAATGVSTPGGQILLAVGGGALLGVGQGWFTQPSLDGDTVSVAKAPFGVAAWGAGVLVMQGAGVASRANVLELGQTISWIGVGILVGTVVGRQNRIGEMRRAAEIAVASGPSVLVLLALSAGLVATLVLGAPPDRAHADEPMMTAEEICDLIAAFPEGANFERFVAPDGDPVFCEAYGPHPVTGARLDLRVTQWADELSAQNQYDGLRSQAQDYASSNPTHCSQHVSIGDEAWALCVDDGIDSAIVRSGRFLLSGTADDIGREPDDGYEGDELPINLLLDLMAATVDDIEVLAETDPPPPGTSPAPSATTPGTAAPATGSTPDSTDQPDDEIGDASAAPPTTPPDTTQPPTDISSEEAAAGAIVGLVAAAAIGLIGAADAGLLAGSLLGGGPPGPGAAGPSTGGATPPATPPTRTVVVSGPDAEAVLTGGVGSTVPIPDDQQWDTNVSVPGQPPVTGGRVGSVGVVRSIGSVVRDDRGNVSVSVDVDAHDPSAPPPPPPIDDPVPVDGGTEPDATLAPPREPPPPPPIDEDAPPDIDLPPVSGPEADLPEPAPPRLPPEPPEPPQPPEPPDEPPEPPGGGLTPEDLRDPEFRRWLEDQHRFQEDLAGYYRGGEGWAWFEWMLGGTLNWTYTGADWSISILGNLTGGTGKSVKEAWDVAKHGGRAVGRSMVDGQWGDNMARAGGEWAVEKAWSAGFGQLAKGLGAGWTQRPTGFPGFDRINFDSLGPGNLTSQGLRTAGDAAQQFVTEQTGQVFGRDLLKDWSGLFDWSPPWPTIP